MIYIFFCLSLYLFIYKEWFNLTHSLFLSPFLQFLLLLEFSLTFLFSLSIWRDESRFFEERWDSGVNHIRKGHLDNFFSPFFLSCFSLIFASFNSFICLQFFPSGLGCFFPNKSGRGWDIFLKKFERGERNAPFPPWICVYDVSVWNHEYGCHAHTGLQSTIYHCRQYS